MKFSENSAQAAGYLRQAIPIMVKYNIVPNPLNYTLWYSYYSKAFPSLNNELDKTVKRYGTCPPDISESLFFRHMNNLDNENKKQLVDFQNIFSHLVNDLSDSMDHTAQQTNSYSQALMENLTELGTHSIDDATAPLLNKLSANASAICTANEEFQGQLSAAQFEIKTLKAELENSKKEANTDPLTGLYNRRVFETIYNQFVDNENNHDDITLIMMDVDKFKIFNDTHGHLVGDQILKVIGQLLKKECKDPILPVRLGGEEFAVLCPRFKLEQAKIIAEDIRVKLASVPFSSKRTGERIPPVTASFGVAQKRPNDSLTNIIERADQALYAAKNAGRNRVKSAAN
ncbi:MAG: diguanylate cyclase [Paraglaciecola sp.]|jgi:diguanylate cyclase